MTHEAMAQVLFGDLNIQPEDTNPPPLLGKDFSCSRCNDEQSYQDLLEAVTACDGLEREIDLDPAANDPLPDLDLEVA